MSNVWLKTGKNVRIWTHNIHRFDSLLYKTHPPLRDMLFLATRYPHLEARPWGPDVQAENHRIQTQERQFQNGMEEVIDKHGVDFPFLANMKRLGAWWMWQGWGVWQNQKKRRCSITCPHYLWSIFWGVPSHWFPCQQKCSNNRNLMSLEFWKFYHPPCSIGTSYLNGWVPTAMEMITFSWFSSYFPIQMARD